MNIILVGGPADGRRVVILDGKSSFECVSFSGNPFDTNVQHTKHRYNKFPIHPVTRAYVFAHEDLTPTQIMERLLDNYRPMFDGGGGVGYKGSCL